MTGIEMSEFVENLSIEELNTLASKIECEKNRRNSVEREKAEKAFWEAAKNLYKICPTYAFHVMDGYGECITIEDFLFCEKKL